MTSPRSKNTLTSLPQPSAKLLPQSLANKVTYLKKTDLQKLECAYQLAEQAHRGVLRKSGDPFVTHVIAVAELLAEMNLDVEALMAGLLHDTVEDTHVSFEDIEAQFGSKVRQIVEGETKISKLSVRVYEDEQSENLRQMLLAMVNDARIILVKLADRLHNMRTLEHMPEAKQKKIARETIEIFAPLAHRLGISHIQNELEDLSFSYLEPERYNSLQRQVRLRHAERQSFVNQAIALLENRLAREGLSYEVYGRSKHLYSIHRKMLRDSKSIDQIFDLMAIRTIIDTPLVDGIANPDSEKAACYRALGIVHSLWTPIPGRFKDYVAVPKPNGYQSLHTTVIGLQGQPIEVQIRTRSMHEIAEYGVAAHWAYKEGIEDTREVEQRLDWMKQLLDVNETTDSAGAFVETVKTDFLSERVLVFTPAGDVMNLPRGSTTIDFAYHVHTQVGHRCIGARVNGNIVPLNYELQTGDRIEVLTNKSTNYGPSSDWVNIATTRSAKQKIRHYFRQQERQGQLENGKKQLERALRRKNLAIATNMTKAKLEAVTKQLLHADAVDDLFLALDSKRLMPKQVIDALLPEQAESKPTRKAPPAVAKSLSGVLVDGLDAPANLAQCCSPVRGDDVMGYITRGRGVSVHRIDCPNVKHLMQTQNERFINVSWDISHDDVYPVDFEIVAIDRPSLLKDVLDVLAEMNKSASRISADVPNHQSARIYFRVSVKDHKEIEHIKENISRIPDVIQIYRNKPGIKD